jgi:Holliday junction DNA helicase RuvA
MEVSAFQRAISTADVRLLSKMPGIGKKTAERLVIEMRDKFKGKNKAIGSPITLAGVSDLATDAINALVHLGYNAMDAHRAIQDVMSAQKEETDLGRLITAALRRI